MKSSKSFPVNKVKRCLYLSVLRVKHYRHFLFAHKPLCSRFHEDVLRVGDVRVCRSCTCIYAGAATAAAYLAVVPLTGVVMTLYIGVLLLTLGLSHPLFYKKLPRRVRDVLRFSLGVLLVCTAFCVFTYHIIIGGLCAAALLLFRRYYAVSRKERKLNACNGCPEYNGTGICSGFAVQAAAARAFEHEASEWVTGQGYMPDVLTSK